MADDEMIARIRVALDEVDRIDAGRVDVTRDGDAVVLRGAVATPEEATVAAMVAEQQTERVRNELLVDPGLREGATGDVEQVQTPATAPEDPTRPADDLTADAEEALGENVAWDPPDAPWLAPTRAEERGIAAPGATTALDAEEGPDDADEPSAGDLSAAELAQTARRNEREDT